MLVMGGTRQLKWESQQLMPSESDACSRGRWTSSLHKSADDETDVAALAEPTVSKEGALTKRPYQHHFEHWTLRHRNAVDFELTEKILHNIFPSDVMEISADLAGDSENWCVTIATASSGWVFQWQLRWTQTFWTSRVVHTWTRSIFFSTATTFAVHPTFFLSVKSCVKFSPLFVSNHSLTSQGCPASQTLTQAAHSTAHIDKQTRANHTKTCFLTFTVIAPLVPKHCYYTMTFISPTAKTDNNWQDAHLPLTETEREMAPGADETNWRHKKI